MQERIVQGNCMACDERAGDGATSYAGGCSFLLPASLSEIAKSELKLLKQRFERHVAWV